MKHLVLLSFITISISIISTLFLQNKVNKILISDIESLAENESDKNECKWKVYDCPGWFTGDYESCVSNGDGNSCSCGEITRNCDK